MPGRSDGLNKSRVSTHKSPQTNQGIKLSPPPTSAILPPPPSGATSTTLPKSVAESTSDLEFGEFSTSNDADGFGDFTSAK